MADEDQDDGGGGGGGLTKLILPLVALIIGGGGGYFAGSTLTANRNEAASLLKPVGGGDVPKDTSGLVGEMFKLDAFVVNLSEPGGRGNRYLKTTIQLEMDSPDLEPELRRREAQLKDVILALLTSKSSKELQALEGKFRLREELLSRINALLVYGAVSRVYFTEFVIQ